MCRSSLKSCRREISDLQGLVTSPPVFNYGKGVDEVQERQKRRKVATLKESCQQALSFVESYNAEVTTISIKTKTTKETLTFQLGDSSSSSPHTPSPSPSCSSFSDETEQILYLLDRYGVSDQFYHELAMTMPALPRSYKVKRARQTISSTVELKRLPRPYDGCYRSMKEMLISLLSAEVSKFSL